MDTTTPQGEFLFHIFGALAQFERSLIQERVRPGLPPPAAVAAGAAAPPRSMPRSLARSIAALDGGATKAAVCRTFGIKRSTLINFLARIGWSAGLKGRRDAVTRRQQLTEIQIAELFDPPTKQRELVRHYTLSDADITMIRRCRGDHNRLGYALMLCYLRYPGRPLHADEHPAAALVAFVAGQIDVLPDAINDYLSRADRRRQRHASCAKTSSGFVPSAHGRPLS